MPRWLIAVFILAFFLILYGAHKAVDSSSTRRDAVADVLTKIVQWGKTIEGRIEALEETPTTVNNQVLSIKAVETVCHSGHRVWAFRFVKDDGAEGWAIVPKLEAWGANHKDLRLQPCDGTESIHPHDRAKLLEEQEAAQ